MKVVEALPLRARVLGGVLRRLGGLRLDRFTDRLSLQKRVYLLQAFGVHLGYQFSWYLHGPYSPGLTQDAYAIQGSYNRLPEFKFDEKEYEERVQRFVEFLGDKADDTEWLELIASIHFLRKVYSWENKEQIIGRVEIKQPYFNQGRCEVAWHELEAVGLMQ